MTVFVTGGSGFLGSFVIPRLVRSGTVVACLVRSDVAATRVERLGAQAVRGDLDDPGSVRRALDVVAPRRVVSLASLGTGHGPGLVDVLTDRSLDRTTFVSTTAVTTRLAAPSKAVRLAAEAAILDRLPDAVILRPTMIYGAAGDRNMERLLRFLARSPVVPAPGAGRLHQPVHVDDLAATVVAAVDPQRPASGVIDVPGPEPLPFRRLVREAAAALGRHRLVVPVPGAPLVAATHVVGRLWGASPVSAEQVQRMLEDKCFDPTPAALALGHHARPFRDGIAHEARALGLA